MRNSVYQEREGIQTAGRGGRLFLAAVLTAAVMLAVLAFCPFRALALDAGEYLVTVTPSYTDPESGKVEDPGNNAAIGQGMTERLCGSTGLLEVDKSGNMWLTVRYYLSQFVSNVSFEERSGGSYLTRSHTAMQTREPVAGATDITEKYGFTDYRFPIGSMDSVFRGKAYIEPMGRDVVYFLTVGSPVEGSGDFIVSAKAAEPETTAAQTAGTPAETAAQTESPAETAAPALAETPVLQPSPTGAENDAYAYYPEELEDEDWGNGETGGEAGAGTVSGAAVAPDAGNGYGAGTAGNGSGNADDPVTGIPQKPGSSRVGAGTGAGTGTSGTPGTVTGTSGTGAGAAAGATGTGTGAASGASDSARWSAATGETASAEARRYGESLLKDAVGITMTVGDAAAISEEAKSSGGDGGQGESNGYKNMMYVLLGAAAALLVCFGVSSVKKAGDRKTENRGESAKAKTPEPERRARLETSGQDAAGNDTERPDEIERRQGETR